MNKKLSSRYNMFLAVLALCNEYPAIVSLIVAFKNAKDTLTATVAAIEAALAEKLQLTTGVAGSKTAQKEKLSRLAYSVAAALYAWSSSINNEVIMAQSKLSYSDILKYRDDEVATVCLNIHTLAKNNMGELKDFGLTDTINDMLLTAATNYRTALPAPRNAQARKKAANEAIATLLSEGIRLIKTQMDTTSVLLAATNPTFVKEYKANRKLVNLPTIRTQIKGEMLNGQTQTPIENGELFIVELNKKIYTNDKGQLASGKVPNGKYTIMAIAENFQPKELTEVEVKRGKITRLKIELVSELTQLSAVA